MAQMVLNGDQCVSRHYNWALYGRWANHAWCLDEETGASRTLGITMIGLTHRTYFIHFSGGWGRAVIRLVVLVGHLATRLAVVHAAIMPRGLPRDTLVQPCLADSGRPTGLWGDSAALITVEVANLVACSSPPPPPCWFRWGHIEPCTINIWSDALLPGPRANECRGGTHVWQWCCFCL